VLFSELKGLSNAATVWPFFWYQGEQMLIGYARVSTLDQDTALQLDALRAANVRRVYQDKASGVGDRPQLQAAIAGLRPGDSLVVWKLDRIARSLSDLLGIIGRVKASQASIRSLTEPIDTSSPIGEFTLQVLGAVAQLERSMIRERTIAGQVAALQRGKSIGRPRILPPEKENQLYAEWQSGQFSKAELSRRYNVGTVVVYRVIHEHERPDHPWVRRSRPVLGKYLKG
jgi:DNA invertase Pin-like site-specific DNA recombinase